MIDFRIEPPAGAAGPEGVVHLVMDDPERAVCRLDEAALGALDEALAALESRPGLRGVVLRSAREGFAIGDVDELAGTREAARERARRGQGVLQRLAALPCPTVAAIRGACLGAGLELALACASRVAADEPTTRLGLPETLLGALPAFGGPTRLPRLVGLAAALDLLLSGRNLGARQAEALGLVARAVPPPRLLEEAHRRLAALPVRRGVVRRDRWRPRGLRSWWADGTPFGRAWALTRAQALVRARGGQPAAQAALSVLGHGAGQPAEVSQRLEVEWAGDLAGSPECANLVRLFRLDERARRDAPPGVAPPPLEHLQVLGAGSTGIEIAERASRSGMEVRLRDPDAEALARGLARLRAAIEARRARGAPAHEAEAQWARVTAGTELAGLRLADLAVEATGEDLDTKRRVFGELEVRLRPEAVLVSTTSFVPLDELAAGLERPERLVGLHLPDPVARVPLVEVVRGPRTAPEAVAAGHAFVLRLGRTPVMVADRPGFVVDRVLYPALREALHLLEEGFPVGDIDGALRAFGMVRGPCAWMDEVGLDVVRRGLEALGRAFPDRIAPVPGLDAMVEAGRLGRRAGAGFYQYGRRGARPDHWAGSRLGAERRRRPVTPEVLADRVVLAMINEAARALEDGVVPDAGLLDLALVHGAGFPASRGGPLRHADALGLERVEVRLNALRAERGERFQPAGLLARLAAAGGSFTGGAAG